MRTSARTVIIGGGSAVAPSSTGWRSSALPAGGLSRC